LAFPFFDVKTVKVDAFSNPTGQNASVVAASTDVLQRGQAATANGFKRDAPRPSRSKPSRTDV
jgi:hypothetical protein